MSKEYIKHLIECTCFLPQFKNLDPVPFHKFVAFSALDDSASVIPSYSQCTNCGRVHRVTEVGKSQLLKKESMPSLLTEEDMRSSLPEWLSALLEKNNCDIATWQEAKFIYENALWGRPVILSKERDENENISGKYVLILGETLYKIEAFERYDGMV